MYCRHFKRVTGCDQWKELWCIWGKPLQFSCMRKAAWYGGRNELQNDFCERKTDHFKNRKSKDILEKQAMRKDGFQENLQFKTRGGRWYLPLSVCIYTYMDTNVTLVAHFIYSLLPFVAFYLSYKIQLCGVPNHR